MDADLRDGPVALRYLEHVEALTAEIEAAMRAVGAHALSDFERSISRQQGLCDELCRVAEPWRSAGGATVGAGPGAGARPVPGEGSLGERIRQAAASLQQLNATYASLLRHSGDTVRVFAGLCHSYTGHYQQPGTDPRGHQAWSCEL
ncbi:MAG TPA: hypothetical protein VGD62_13655 [Acidobacteriaceae bacterium]